MFKLYQIATYFPCLDLKIIASKQTTDRQLGFLQFFISASKWQLDPKKCSTRLQSELIFEWTSLFFGKEERIRRVIWQTRKTGNGRNYDGRQLL